MGTTVLIVGAGPVGLVLAATLARRGVDLRIIDKHAAPLELTKSAALHARTLEHFRDLGVVDRVLDEGRRVDVLALRTGHRDRLRVDFRVLRDTAFPHMVDLPQNRTEHLLVDRLTDLGVDLERQVTLTGLSQDPSGVRAEVVDDAGRREAITADYIVGCDGSRSTVRRLLGLNFRGAAYADDWVLCDAVVDWPLPRNEMTFSADRDGIYGVFPLPGDRRYRLAYTRTTRPDGRPVEPDRADAQAAMARSGIDGTIREVDQFWTFSLSHHLADRYRQGRVFLAGDAGHVHTPFGGQGLNLGVGDAVDLGWKLAAVVLGRAPAGLLDSYEAERRSVAREVVTFTHLGASAMLLRSDPRVYLRDAAMAVADAAAPARRRLARSLSQLALTYRGTPAVSGRAPALHGGGLHGGGLHGGDRLPDLPVFDGVTNRAIRLHDLLSTERHTALLVGRGRAAPLLQAWRSAAGALGPYRDRVAPVMITDDWRLDPARVPGVPVVLDRHGDTAAVGGRHPRMLLVRPDGHIGHVGPVDPVTLDRHLRTVATVRSDSSTVPGGQVLEMSR